MITAVGKLVKSMFVGFLALFKRALCFLSRKRRNSGSILPTHIQQSTLDMPTQVLSNNFEIPPSPVDHSSHVVCDCIFTTKVYLYLFQVSNMIKVSLYAKI